jgi:hypothetical protein
MRDDPRARIVAAGLLEEYKHRLQYRQLSGTPVPLWNTGTIHPLLKRPAVRAPVPTSLIAILVTEVENCSTTK